MKPNRIAWKLSAICLVLLLSLLGLAYSQGATNFDLIHLQASRTGANSFFAQNWFANWQAAGLAAVMVMVALIALAYMGAQLLQIEDLKNFSRSELVQAGGSVLLLLLVIFVLGMADTTMAYLTNPSSASHIYSPCQSGAIPPVSSTSPPISSAPALNQYAYCYVRNLQTLGSAQGDAIIRQSVDYAAQAYRSVGFSTDQWFLLYVSATYRPNANLRLDSEVKGQEFDLLSKFLISLQGQMYFLEYIVPVLGPGLLLLGLILRCLSFTRRLGGLLIASGLGLMIILPATYLLAWFTLQVAVVGPQAIAEPPPSTCPAECKILAPIAYDLTVNKAGTTIGWAAGAGSMDTAAFDKLNAQLSAANQPTLSAGDEKTLLANTPSIQTCFPKYSDVTEQQYDAATKTYKMVVVKSASDVAKDAQGPNPAVPYDASIACPAECRFLPTPINLQCDSAACEKLPMACKTIRAIPPVDANGNTQTPQPITSCLSTCPASVCPDFCKLTLPQVAYTDPATDGGPIIPTPHAGFCMAGVGGSSCESCPNYCRSYVSESGKLTATLPDGSPSPDCSGCASCFNLQDTARPTPSTSWTSPPAPSSAAGAPDCMTGIPAIRTADCSDPNLCGSPARFADIVQYDSKTNLPQTVPDSKDSSKTDLVLKGPLSCPVDCRAFFDTSKSNDQSKYQDPFWAYCQLDPIKTACSTCPIYCKINASTALGVPLSGSNTPVQVNPGNGLPNIDCAIPPAFTGDCSQAGMLSGNCQMDPTVSDLCGRCPLSCRLRKPSSINDPSIDPNQIKSNSHYAQTCLYLDDVAHTLPGTSVIVPGVSIQYGPQMPAPGTPDCPPGWYVGPPNIVSIGGARPAIAFPPPQKCSPTKQLYQLAPGQSALCPLYLSDNVTYAVQNPPVSVAYPPDTAGTGWEVSLSDVYLSAGIQPNPDVSAECSTPDAQIFCSSTIIDPATKQPYCPAACTVDRTIQGPYYCAISDITNHLAALPDNNQIKPTAGPPQPGYCPACYQDNLPAPNQHTTGPQCQVILEYGGTSYSPLGCSPQCQSATTDPAPPRPACDGFCYPRLEVPTHDPNIDTNLCSGYMPGAVNNPAASLITGAACPIACRYDYISSTTGLPAMSAIARKACGKQDASAGDAGWTDGIHNSRNCDPTCGITPNGGKLTGRVGPTAADLSSCTNDAYTCVQDAGAADWWARPANARAVVMPNDNNNCHQNVVAYGAATYQANDVNFKCAPPQKGVCALGCHLDNPKTSCLRNNDWYVDSCQLGAGTFALNKNSKPYTCTRHEVYPGIDAMVAAASHIPVSDPTAYYECGDLNFGNTNPALDFCGSVTVQNIANPIYNGRTVTALPQYCQAQYNARAVACLPYASYIRDDLGTSSQIIKASGDCQQCPLFCRIPGTTCSAQLTPNLHCDPVKSDGNGGYTGSCDLNNALSPAGYCSVPLKAFNLISQGGTCADPKLGSGVGCPARCRIRMSDGSVPAGCDTPAIGDACKSIDDACRASVLPNPCQTCSQCQLDCQAKPYVRQNCDEVCAPGDVTSGATHLAPDQLLSSFSGANGNALWNSLGSLAIAAILLPIFAFILTIAFIRSLSPLLGGDMEIPGLLKLI